MSFTMKLQAMNERYWETGLGKAVTATANEDDASIFTYDQYSGLFWTVIEGQPAYLCPDSSGVGVLTPSYSSRVAYKFQIVGDLNWQFEINGAFVIWNIFDNKIQATGDSWNSMTEFTPMFL